MYEAHSVFDTPSEEARIWRYLDFVKFSWLLLNGALYFPRADQLGDPHEGALPRTNLAARDAVVQKTPMWQWAPGIDPERPTWTTTVLHLFVSCWNLSDYENALLWSVYGKGVAIESTVGDLRDALQTNESVYIGRVRYIDYDRDSFPGDNAFHPIVHKRRAFEAEREVRAVVPGSTHADSSNGSAWTGDPRRGIAVPVDIQRLVRGIWIAPGETMLYQVATRLLERLGIAKPVRQSSLDDPPRY